MRIYNCIVLCIGLLSVASNIHAQVEQVSIPRIDLMPDEPSPYSMRDWREVAMGYDSFVYDISKTGQYLPLVFIRPQGLNYPENKSFGLDTYVGTFSNNNGEAINVLPSIVGATLVGIDKTNQFGQNWVLMSQDYFNKANGENIYLNNIGGHSGGDWWYDMMPNIYFYQLYDLYGKIGDAENQFVSVADRMEEAVRIMGGKATPWTRAFMDYRAFDFLHGTPNPDGVHEPEAAGAYAWLLYHAYKERGDLAYLQAAEWSMEYLVNLNSNPSYELQLPYGAYVAAKMNAEIGTEYNVEKLVFWTFHRGPLRGWGTIVGNWNGFDVSGLVGEANDGGNDYAFQLNGVQQAGALVPMVRYDKLFAKAIGKWILNVSNATRLMFPGFLPAHLQDASAWSQQYDPEGVIGYEALREVWMGQRPLATGDALRSGWAATNLSLYSTSSIGYLGSIIEKTNEEKILQIDLLRTDFFRDSAYPSFLYYNPHDVVKYITLDVGTQPVDIYDVISESFIAQGVSNTTSLQIHADSIISIVLAPANGAITFDKNKMLINDVIVDYRQTSVAYNYPPRIQAFATESTIVEKNTTVTLYAKGIDQETKDLVYTFFTPDDTISGLERTATWVAPNEEGTFVFMLVAADEAGQTDTSFLTISVVSEININPVISSLAASSRFTSPGGTIDITAIVEDVNGDPITYEWTTSNGEINGTGNEINWTAPEEEGIYAVYLTVSDGRGGTASASISLLVLDPALHVDGDLIAWYPFAGNAQDISGNALHGQVSGAKLTPDSLGNPNQAYFFDGVNDHIRVSNQAILNFTDGITISLFVNPEVIGDKERFIISHGSWQNRWKVSITPERKLRWTIKFTNGVVKDLDSETILEENINYHVGVTYNGRFIMLYINGRLESFIEQSGEINPSPVDLEIGQILPDDPAYSFRGVLDEIKIYNYALTPDSIAAESGNPLTGTNEIETDYSSFFIYPNPGNGTFTIDLTALKDEIFFGNYKLFIVDNNGRTIWSTSITGNGKHNVNLTGVSPGVYSINVLHNGKTRSQQLIIINK